MEDEVQRSGLGWGNGVTAAGGAKDGVCGAGDDPCARQPWAKSGPSPGECPSTSVTSEDGAVSQGPVILPVAAGVVGMTEALVGTARVGAWLLLCHGGSGHGRASETV